MNGAHIHLVINHFPIVGLIFALCVLLYAALRSHAEYLRLGLVALVLLALISIPVYVSGEGAEEVIENLPAYTAATHDLLEQHEDAAMIALIGVLVLGGVAALLLFADRRSPDTLLRLRFVPVVLAALVAGLFVYTANLGGQIMHPEIRATGGAQAGDAPPTESGGGDMEHHGHDED